MGLRTKPDILVADFLAVGSPKSPKVNQKHRSNKLTRRVGVTNVRQGFSIPPYGKEGGSTSKSYTPHTYGPSRSSAAFNICSVCKEVFHEIFSKLLNEGGRG